MKKSLALILILFSCQKLVMSQSMEIRAGTGMGTFYMKDLKTLQDLNTSPGYPILLRKLSSFPMWYGYDLSIIVYNRKGAGIGGTASFFSTGARNAYEDYSGHYYSDILARCINIGLLVSIPEFSDSTSRLRTNLEIQAGVKSSTINLIDDILLGTDRTVSKTNVGNLSPWFLPMARLMYWPTRSLGLGAFLGFEINPEVRLHLAGNKKAYLQLYNGKKIRSSWSGVRFGLTLSFRYKSLSDNQGLLADDIGLHK